MIPWCSGYHICLTRRRSPVRSRVESTDFWKQLKKTTKFYNQFRQLESMDLFYWFKRNTGTVLWFSQTEIQTRCYVVIKLKTEKLTLFFQ